jgi:hypothetical protein
MIVVKGKLGDKKKFRNRIPIFIVPVPTRGKKKRSSSVHVGLGHWLGWILIMLVIIVGLG